MGSYNFLTVLIPKQLEWENKDLANSLIGTAAPLGAAVGALTGGKIASIGRRNAILIINVVLVLGIGISELKSFGAIIVGRLIMGGCAGCFSVISPMFISEICPPEYAGPFGVINQFMVCFGILVIYILGVILVPYENDADLLTSNCWRYLFAFPLIFVVI